VFFRVYGWGRALLQLQWASELCFPSPWFLRVVSWASFSSPFVGVVWWNTFVSVLLVQKLPIRLRRISSGQPGHLLHIRMGLLHSARGLEFICLQSSRWGERTSRGFVYTPSPLFLETDSFSALEGPVILLFKKVLRFCGGSCFLVEAEGPWICKFMVGIWRDSRAAQTVF